MPWYEITTPVRKLSSDCPRGIFPSGALPLSPRPWASKHSCSLFYPAAAATAAIAITAGSGSVNAAGSPSGDGGQASIIQALVSAVNEHVGIGSGISAHDAASPARGLVGGVNPTSLGPRLCRRAAAATPADVAFLVHIPLSIAVTRETLGADAREHRRGGQRRERLVRLWLSTRLELNVGSVALRVVRTAVVDTAVLSKGRASGADARREVEPVEPLCTSFRVLRYRRSDRGIDSIHARSSAVRAVIEQDA